VTDLRNPYGGSMVDKDLRVTPPLAQKMTEDELLAAILDAAKYLGWRAYHVRNSKAGIIQGDAGFPDLVLARKGRVLFVELKSEKGKLTPCLLYTSDAADE